MSASVRLSMRNAAFPLELEEDINCKQQQQQTTVSKWEMTTVITMIVNGSVYQGFLYLVKCLALPG